MCKDRPDGWSVIHHGGKGIEIASVYIRADGVVAIIPHSSSMYGGILDGEHVCKICFTIYSDEDPWDRENRFELERQLKHEEDLRRRIDERRQAEAANRAGG